MADNQAQDVDELYQRIIEEYESTRSIAEIAKRLGTTLVKVQRVLITEGLWTSKRTEQIAELRAQGLSVDQIAEQLGKDVKTIQTFLPYSRGQYGKSDTDEAARAKDYRDRMRSAAEKMKTKEERKMKEIYDLDEAYKNGANGEGNIKTRRHTEEELEKNPFLHSESVYRLRFELVDHFLNGGGEYFEGEEKERFLKLAKAKEGIVREVLVPSTMNLHSLHFMIQRLFGWQNSHLHNFCISQDEFNALTGKTVGGWQRLCGSLLHFTQDEDTDFYWDDDYGEGESVKSWLKRKYVGPYKQKAVCETYFATRQAVDKFNDFFKEFGPEMTLEELQHKIIMEESLNFLNERLTLGELLTIDVPSAENRTEEYAKWLGKLDKEIAKTDVNINGMSAKHRKHLSDAVDNLQGWRRTKDVVEEKIYYREATSIKEQTGKTAKKWLEEAQVAIPFWEGECEDLFVKYNPKLTPLFDTLYYEYDYGDGWCVKITVLNQYDRKTNADLTNSGWFVLDILSEADKLKNYRYFENGIEVDEELRAKLAHVDAKERPLCTVIDGLNVLDDVGGLGGYMDMLETLAGRDVEEKASMREWARGQGWTGRSSKPENYL